MRERPIQDLVDGLQQLGVSIQCSATSCPPVQIQAEGLQAGQVALIPIRPNLLSDWPEETLCSLVVHNNTWKDFIQD